MVAVVLSGYAILLVSDSYAPIEAPRSGGSASAMKAISSPAVSGGDAPRELHVSYQSVIPYGRTTLQLPTLMYHYIRVPPSRRLDPVGYNLSVAPEVFTAQMDWLAGHGYHTVTFDDVRRYWAGVAPLPAKPVIITLDDGYQDLYTTAFPILQAHRFTAVAYIVSGFVGQPGYVTSSEILEMDRDGIEIGAHTVGHTNLARAKQPSLTYQVAQSKVWLENLVGHSVVDMAYPYGKYDAPAVASVQHAGYWSAVTEQYSVLHSQSDRFVWGRVRVGGGETLAMFITDLGPAMQAVTVTRAVRTPTVIDLHHLF